MYLFFCINCVYCVVIEKKHCNPTYFCNFNNTKSLVDGTLPKCEDQRTMNGSCGIEAINFISKRFNSIG